MKTSLKNQYAYTYNILITIVSTVLGYNIYQAIVHPEKSHLVLSLILAIFTYFIVRKYGSQSSK